MKNQLRVVSGNVLHGSLGSLDDASKTETPWGTMRSMNKADGTGEVYIITYQMVAKIIFEQLELDPSDTEVKFYTETKFDE
jgi:polynucleotide 5'-kinase involved in rRNA processing